MQKIENHIVLFKQQPGHELVCSPCGLGLTERASCWRLKRALAQITCLKDVIEPIHFGENLVLNQCWHADELCSGVARGTMIMVRACRMISAAQIIQDESIMYTQNHTNSFGTQALHLWRRDFILEGERSETL